MKTEVLPDDIVIQIASLRHPSPASRLAFTAIFLANRYNMLADIDADVVKAVRTVVESPTYHDVLLYGEMKQILNWICPMIIPSRREAEEVNAKAVETKFIAVQFLQDNFYNAPDLQYPDKWVIGSDGIALLVDSAGTPGYKVTLGSSIHSMQEKLTLMQQLAPVKIAFSGNPCEWDVPEKTAARKMSAKTVAFTMPVSGAIQIPVTRTHLSEAVKLLRQALWNEGYRLIAAEKDQSYDFNIELCPSNIDCVMFRRNNPVAAAFADILGGKDYQKIQLDAEKKKEPAYACVGFVSDHADIANAMAQIRRLALNVGKAIAEVLK